MEGEGERDPPLPVEGEAVRVVGPVRVESLGSEGLALAHPVGDSVKAAEVEGVRGGEEG